MSWRATVVSLLAQLLGTAAVALVVALIWASTDDVRWTVRWGLCLAIGGGLYLVLGGSLGPRMTSMGYAQWSIGSSRGIRGDDDRGSSSRLTSLGESLIVGGALIAAGFALM